MKNMIYFHKNSKFAGASKYRNYNLTTAHAEHFNKTNEEIKNIMDSENLSKEEKVIKLKEYLHGEPKQETVEPAIESKPEIINPIKTNIQNIRKTVCTLANKINQKLKDLSASFKKAWQLIKNKVIQSKITGVTFGNTQKILSRLTRYTHKEVTAELIREPENKYDINAIAVTVSVKESKAVKIGYLPRDLAQYLSKILDKGLTLKTTFKGITGGNTNIDDYYYGALVEIEF